MGHLLYIYYVYIDYRVGWGLINALVFSASGCNFLSRSLLSLSHLWRSWVVLALILVLSPLLLLLLLNILVLNGIIHSYIMDNYKMFSNLQKKNTIVNYAECSEDEVVSAK